MENIILEILKQSLLGGILFVIVYWQNQKIDKRDERNNQVTDKLLENATDMVKSLEGVVTRNTVVMERVERKLDEK